VSAPTTSCPPPARGDLAGAVRGYQRGVAGFAGEQPEEYLRWRISALSGVALTTAMLGDVAGATACHEEILATCEPRGEHLCTGLSLCFLAIVHRRQGELAAATARATEALRRLRRVSNTITTSWCLDALAWIAVDQGRLKRAATLLSAAERLTLAMGTRAGLVPDLTANHEQYQQQTRAALGEQAYRAAAAHGEQMSLDQAVSYALDEPRKRAAPQPVAAPGARPTPLTHREQQVAELITQGLSNKEIAAKLVISRRTAESHVEHILTKLGCANRAQVAAWIPAQHSPTTRNEGNAD